MSEWVLLGLVLIDLRLNLIILVTTLWRSELTVGAIIAVAAMAVLALSSAPGLLNGRDVVLLRLAINESLLRCVEV